LKLPLCLIDTYGSNVENGDVVGEWTEGEFEDVRRRNPIFDLHRPLVHHKHRARRYDEEDWNELLIKTNETAFRPVS
jgi:hypothetical protein